MILGKNNFLPVSFEILIIKDDFLILASNID